MFILVRLTGNQASCSFQDLHQIPPHTLDTTMRIAKSVCQLTLRPYSFRLLRAASPFLRLVFLGK